MLFGLSVDQWIFVGSLIAQLLAAVIPLVV